MPLWNSLNKNNNSNPNSGDPYAPPPPQDDNDDDNDDTNNYENDDFYSILEAYTPLLQKLTLSSVLGYCSAITAKRIGKSLAFTVGLGFIVCQGLVYKGIVNVDWKQVEKSVAQVVDTVSQCSSSEWISRSRMWRARIEKIVLMEDEWGLCAWCYVCVRNYDLISSISLLVDDNWWSMSMDRWRFI